MVSLFDCDMHIYQSYTNLVPILWSLWWWWIQIRNSNGAKRCDIKTNSRSVHFLKTEKVSQSPFSFVIKSTNDFASDPSLSLGRNQDHATLHCCCHMNMRRCEELYCLSQACKTWRCDSHTLAFTLWRRSCLYGTHSPWSRWVNS